MALTIEATCARYIGKSGLGISLDRPFDSSYIGGGATHKDSKEVLRLAVELVSALMRAGDGVMCELIVQLEKMALFP